MPTEGHFVANRPADIRAATLTHRYGHHIRVLPARLAALSRQLEVADGGRVLDYGCADVPYRHFFGAKVNFVAADLPGNPAATLTLNEDTTVPVESGTFDAVMSTQVLEHVSDPDLYLSESFRVLRPGGRLLLSTHGVFIYHPDPVDYWRWTCAGLRRVVELQGFEVLSFEGIIGPTATGLQLIQDATRFRLPRPLRPVMGALFQLFMGLADRLESREMKDMNGQVFGLVARKP